MEGGSSGSKRRLRLLLAALLSLWPGIGAKARFKEDGEVLQMLAGNSSQSLLERCAELLFGRARAQPRQVNGVLGGSVVLSAALPPNATVREIEWSFSAGAGATIQIAELSRGRFERPDPGDRFRQRLEMFNATSLRISALEPGDGGLYGARVKLLPAVVHDQSFNLSVFEAVPSPRTRSQLLASTAEWCNLTLQCQGSGKGAVNVTWRKGDAGRRPRSDHQQLSADGTTLRLALQPGAANASYACTVSNPADQKVVVFDLQTICRGGGAPASFSTSGYVVLTLILLAVSLGGAFWCWRLNSEKAAEPAAAAAAAPAEESPSDPQYAEIVRRSPPEGNDQGLGHPENNPEQSPHKAPVTTIYDQVRRTPENAAEEVT